MAKGTASTVPKGSLVELIDDCTGDVISDFGSRRLIWVLRVTDLDYLHEVMNKIDRWWNMDYNSFGSNNSDFSDETNRGDGRVACERSHVSVGSIGLYLGSLNVYDPNFLGSKEPRVCRAVLLEKSVYIVPANCVKWVQGVRKPKKAANNG